MSDSEEEGAFASADEGESPKGDQGSKKTQQAAKKVSPSKNSSANAASKSKTDTPSTEGSGKQKGKQQQQQKQPQANPNTKKKGKGRGNSQPASSKPKESSPGVSPVTDTETPSPAKPDFEDEKTVSELESQITVRSPSPKESKASLSSDEQPAKATVAAAVSSDAAAEKEEETKTKQAGDIRRGIDVSPEKEKTPVVTADKGDDNSSDKAAQQTPAPEKSTDSGGGGWGWGSWGSSILSAATNSVQTFTDQVGGGLVTIIDTVESSLGVPDPEELAKANSEGETSKKNSSDSVATTQPTSSNDNDDAAAATATKKPQTDDESSKQEDKNETETNESKGGGGGWFSSWGVADIAKKVTDTGKSIATKGQTLVTEGFDAVENLASGGIDVLESIGKKTYSTISEHDPAFKKTREYLRSKNEKPNLSGLLREAKDRAAEEATQEAENEEARKAHFGTLFDEYQGIAHLEALEILSNQSEKKVHSLLNTLSSGDIKAIKPVLISIKEVFEVEDPEDQAEESQDQDFSSLVSQHLSELELGTAPDKLNKVHGMVKQWMLDFDSQEAKGCKETPKTIHQQAIQSLAELTSKGVEQFHKAGELVLMQRESDKDCKERAHSFARLTGVLCHEVGNLATKFSDCLNKAATDDEDKTDITSLVTNVYLEASNSSTYMQDAFQLLLPVLQQAAIEHSVLARQS